MYVYAKLVSDHNLYVYLQDIINHICIIILIADCKQPHILLLLLLLFFSTHKIDTEND